MTVNYFKRFRMHFDLAHPIPSAGLPVGYHLLEWNERLLECHSQVKYKSFCEELDANVFPCLGDLDGCRRLMYDITRREGFLPSATWLIAYAGDHDSDLEYCGTIQAIRDAQGIGSIQNVGITPAHRGQGLGKVLLAKSLAGLKSQGISMASLEVTAVNQDAFRLYWQFGFRTVRTVFKTVDIAYAG